MAVSNAIAPEHLELLVDDAEALLPLVRHAGAVFCGPLAPASIGDYLAGPNHVLPTYGSARFSGALRVDDFRKHIHVVTVDDEGLAEVAPHVVALATYEGLPAHADSIRLRDRPRRRRDRSSRRADVALMEGYHSPQLDVAVRLNTNEAPGPPPAAFSASGWPTALAGSTGTATPTAPTRALRTAIADLHGVAPEQVFAANGSNEVLQTLLLTYGGPGRTAAVFEPTYALHSHIARITGTAVAVGERGADFALDVDEVRSVLAEVRPEVTFLCSPNNPTGMVEPEDVVRTVVDEAPGLVVVDEAYGQFAPWSALELVDDERPLVVTRTFSKTWSMAAARLGYLVGPAWLVEQLDKVVLPYHLDAFKQAAGRGRAGVRRRDAGPGRRTSSRSGAASPAALADLPVDVWPSGANFVLFRPAGRLRATRCGRRWSSASVLVRNCASWPRLDGCLRVTIGTPDEDDAFLDALREVLA